MNPSTSGGDHLFNNEVLMQYQEVATYQQKGMEA
jgi:hypothetical protein